MFACTLCDRTFTTEKGRDMHCEAKHTFKCPECAKQFRSQRSLDQHSEAVHYEDTDEESSYSSDWPDDPVDSPGCWVYTSDFKGYKSFGFFECQSCEKTWLSAHAYPNYRQGCSDCDYYNYPKLLWQNDKSNKSPRSTMDLTKPHRQDLCGKCQELGHPCWITTAELSY